jgi:hypothetical protein
LITDGTEAGFMADSGLGAWVKRAARSAGRQLAEARSQFGAGRLHGSLPRDDEDRAKIVCRRYAERRAVHLEDGRPECFESGNVACESCVEDVREGVVETW